jgi:membrane protein involved in colicin uptake
LKLKLSQLEHQETKTAVAENEYLETLRQREQEAAQETAKRNAEEAAKKQAKAEAERKAREQAKREAQELVQKRAQEQARKQAEELAAKKLEQENIAKQALAKQQETAKAKLSVGIEKGETTRVERWMAQAEYDKMVETGKVQMSPIGNTSYVANPADPNAFRAALKGSLYVEFDVSSNSIYNAGNESWGQIAGPGSNIDKFIQYKGFSPIIEMPSATNIQIKGVK